MSALVVATTWRASTNATPCQRSYLRVSRDRLHLIDLPRLCVCADTTVPCSYGQQMRVRPFSTHVLSAPGSGSRTHKGALDSRTRIGPQMRCSLELCHKNVDDAFINVVPSVVNYTADATSAVVFRLSPFSSADPTGVAIRFRGDELRRDLQGYVAALLLAHGRKRHRRRPRPEARS